MPDPDLLIRTGKEFRLSNFLLWQLAYTEIYISDSYFPDFKKTELAAATLICWPIILLQREKKTSFLEVSTVSEGDLYFLIKEDIVLSLLDKYFFALFQYGGILLMS